MQDEAEAKEEEGGLPPEEEPDIFELEGERPEAGWGGPGRANTRWWRADGLGALSTLEQPASLCCHILNHCLYTKDHPLLNSNAQA